MNEVSTFAVGSAPGNAYLTTGSGKAIGQREDLSDVIERIDPTETPLFANANKTGCKAIQTDWQVQELQAADNTNKQAEGFDATFQVLKPTDRLANICQILAKTGVVSDTLDAVDKAGRAQETAYQKLLKALEIRRDLEAVLLGTGIKALTDPRSMSCLKSWISNSVMGAGAGAAPAGDGSNVGTTGTLHAVSETVVADAHELAYEDGGKPTLLFNSPKVKRQFSKIGATAGNTGAAVNQLTMSAPRDATVIGSVGWYLTDFGMLELIIDIFMSNDWQLLLDKRHIDICTLPGRSFKQSDLAKTGSNKKFMVEWEGTLRINAPKAHAAVRDIDVSLTPVP